MMEQKRGSECWYPNAWIDDFATPLRAPKLGLSSGIERPAVRSVEVLNQGSSLWSRAVLCSVALLAMNQVVLAAMVLAAGILW